MDQQGFIEYSLGSVIPELSIVRSDAFPFKIHCKFFTIDSAVSLAPFGHILRMGSYCNVLSNPRLGGWMLASVYCPHTDTATEHSDSSAVYKIEVCFSFL